MSEYNMGDVSGGNINIGGTQHIGTQNIYFGRGLVTKPPQRSSQIFLSYGRGDDSEAHDDPTKSFMRKIYNDLIAAGYTVWWDRVSMPTRGLTFNQEIRDAIDLSRRVVLFVGPHALQSDYVRAEWGHALEHCIPVVPIVRIGEYADIPGEIGGVHALDFRDSADYTKTLADLKRILGDPDPQLATLYGLPDKPEGYIVREVFGDLREKVLADTEKPVVVTSVKEKSHILHGLGGIGKSTLAAALGRECKVRYAFPDGIFWLEIGQKPELISRLSDIGAAFGDDPQQYLTSDLNGARMRLSKILENRRTLLILDDVWDHAHAEAFQGFPNGCRLLVTTRQEGIVTKLNAQGQNLQTLSEDEGLELILKRLEAEKPADDADISATLRAIVKILDGHTLAVSLAAAWLSKRGGLAAADKLLDRLKKGRVFKDLRLHKTDKNQNLELCLFLSYDDLSAAEQRRFRLTGVFALEGSFDVAAAMAVWNDADPDDVEDELVKLNDLGLLAQSEDSKPAAPRWERHGLLRAYARALLEKEGELTQASTRHFEHYLAQYGGKQPMELHQEMLTEVKADAANIQAAIEYGLTDDAHVESSISLLTSFDGGYLNFEASLAERNSLLSMALDAAGRADSKLGQANTLKALGDLRLREADLAGAAAAYGQALPLYEAIGARLGQANTYQALGDLRLREADLAGAAAAYGQALPLYEAIGDRLGQANTLMSLGDMLLKQEDWAEALSYYEKALTLAKAIQDKLGMANVLVDMGRARFELGDQDWGIRDMREAVEMFRAAQNPRWAEIAQKRLADMLNRAGRGDEASTLQGGNSQEDQLSQAMQQLTVLYQQVGAEGVKAALKDAGLPEETLEALLAQLAQQAGRPPQSPSAQTLPREALETLAQNTYAVMTSEKDKWEAWREQVETLKTEWQGRGSDYAIEFDLAEGLLAILRGESPTLPDEHPYAEVLRQIVAAIRAAGSS